MENERERAKQYLQNVINYEDLQFGSIRSINDAIKIYESIIDDYTQNFVRRGFDHGK